MITDDYKLKQKFFFEWWKYFKIDYGDFSNSTKINEHYTLNEFFFKEVSGKVLVYGF